MKMILFIITLATIFNLAKCQIQQPIALLVQSSTNRLEVSPDGLQYLERIAQTPVAIILFIKQKLMSNVKDESESLFNLFAKSRQQQQPNTETSMASLGYTNNGFNMRSDQANSGQLLQLFMWPKENDAKIETGFEIENQSNPNETIMNMAQVIGIQIHTELSGADDYDFMKSSSRNRANQMMLPDYHRSPMNGKQINWLASAFNAKALALISLLASHIVYETHDNKTRQAYNDFDALWIEYQRVEALKMMLASQYNWTNFDQQTLEMATLTRINFHHMDKGTQGFNPMGNSNETISSDINYNNNNNQNQLKHCSVQMMPSLINYQLLLLSNGLDRGQLKSYDHQRCDDLLGQIIAGLMPKQMAGQPMTGSKVINLLKDLVMALNDNSYQDWLSVTSLNACETFLQLKLQEARMKGLLDVKMRQETKETLTEWMRHFASLMLRGFPEQQLRANRYLKSIMACKLSM